MFGFIRIRPKFLLLKELYSGYKLQIFVLVVLAVLNGFLGALGIATLIPLFSFVMKKDSLSDDPVSGLVLDTLNYFGIEPGLQNFLILISALFVLKAVIFWFFGLVKIKIVSSYIFDLRRGIYEQTILASWPYLMRHKLGFLENVIMSDVTKVKNLLKDLITSVLKLSSASMYLIVAFGVSALITSVTLGTGAVIMIFSKSLIGKIKGYSKETERIFKLIAHRINENIIGLKTIKAARVEKPSLNEGISFFKRLELMAVRQYFVNSIISQPIEPLMIIFISVVFAISYSLDSNFSIAPFLVVMYLIQRIFGLIEDIQKGLSEFNSKAPHAERVIEFKKEITENKEQSFGDEPFHFHDRLVFKKVVFSYLSDGSRVLKDVSFTVRKGEMFGIVGPSGAGKTTIVDLFLRFFNPDSGVISIDGRDISTIKLDEWRRNIGYVTQDSFLRNDTIRENIRFFRDDISEADVIAVAKDADIYEFINRLPDGFNTVVGERGVYLSGGQRQRIALARALAGKPNILILDEATSALDHKSENSIKRTIKQLKEKITIIIITHRLSAIEGTNRVAVLDKGHIVEQGTAEELRANPDSYFNKM